MRIVHVAAGVGIGGAEKILYQLAQHQNEMGHEVTVINLLHSEYYSSKIARRGIQIISLTRPSHRHKYLTVFRKGWSFCCLLFRLKPEIVHTWLYPSDVAGGIIARILGIPVIWGVFTGRTDRCFYRSSTYMLFKLCCRLSKFVPSAIVSVSAYGRRTHIEAGYDASKIFYIPTGFEEIQTTNGARRVDDIRKTEIVRFGMLGRISVEKDQLFLIKALGELVSEGIMVELVLAGGQGLDLQNFELARCLEESGMKDRTILKGRVELIRKFYENIDVFCLITNSEGFPTVVGEAMSHGLCCLVSDVGDSRILLNDDQQLVRVGDLVELKRKLTWAINLGEKGRVEIGNRNKCRLYENFNIETMVRRYDYIYAKVLCEI